MHQQLWGYKVELKSVSRGTGGKRSNTTGLESYQNSLPYDRRGRRVEIQPQTSLHLIFSSLTSSSFWRHPVCDWHCCFVFHRKGLVQRGK